MSHKYEQFGKYLLLEKIAAGGMAEIYLARSGAANGLNKFFAVKRILPQFSQNEDFVKMFKEEAKVAINLNHSNVVSIFDFGIEAGQFYLVMEYCEGRNLRQIINELKKNNKGFSIDQSLFLIKETAAGLDHAHRCTDATTGRPLNITHRDMSPQNIMVSFEGEVKVIDFGIAKAETEAEETRAGTLKGKFSYMSPEQAEGQPIDPRTDVFALGIVLWELLANDRLFTGSNEAAILRKVRECQIPPIRKINPTVPPELERIVMKALAKDRNIRYQTAANLHRDLNRFLNTQYPDFSPQDFSHFIKESFRATFQEGRDKLISYSKVETSETKKSAEKRDPVIPPPLPISASETKAATHVPEGYEVEQKHKVTLEDLKTAKPRISHNLNTAYTNKYNTNITANGNLYQSKVSQSSYSANSNSASLGGILMKIATVGALSIGGWWGYNNYYLNQNESQRSNVKQKVSRTDSASKAAIKVSVNSSPDGAQIFLNGVDTGNKTPAVVSVIANKEIDLTIKKNGYLDYKVTKSFSETSQVIATLQASLAAAYLNIRVVNANNFTKIFIDGKSLLEKPPILKYPILANKDVTVSVLNPITKQRDEIKVNVTAGDIKDITLQLENTEKTNKK